jgi:two-component system alkaline phosphatase synthesis response regulator PhoP
MLLEDDPTMLSLLKTLLEIEGYQVSHTLDFENTLEAIEQYNPDLILLDVNLREINGIDVLKNIREDQQLRDVTVIMTSGMHLKEECLDKGANDFILKPYMPEELVNKITNLLKE